MIIKKNGRKYESEKLVQKDSQPKKVIKKKEDVKVKDKGVK